MNEIKWIKIVVDIFDDDKIKMIETLPEADTIIVIWFKLLTLAGKKNDSGLIYITRDIPYDTNSLSKMLNRPYNVIELAINTFIKFGMVEILNDFIALVNWEKHQNLDKMELYKEKNRQRVLKHREKQKELCNVTETLHVMQCNGIDKDKDKDKDNNIYSSLDSDVKLSKKPIKEPVLYFGYPAKIVQVEFINIIKLYTENKYYSFGGPEASCFKKIMTNFKPFFEAESEKQKVDIEPCENYVIQVIFSELLEKMRDMDLFYDFHKDKWKIVPSASVMLKFFNSILVHKMTSDEDKKKRRDNYEFWLKEQKRKEKVYHS
jgi:predicted phage replisome organizer